MATTPPAPRVAVLGPVLVENRAGELVEPAGALGKSLIVALVLARGSLSVTSLVEDLWNDAPPRQERAALQTLVSRVRTASADGLLTSTPSGYALGIAPEHTDLGLAREHLERARRADANGDASTAADEAARGLALWRGEPGSELGGTPLADELGRAASSLRDELRLLRARSRRLLGDPAAALRDLESLVDASPLDERVQLERLRALDAAGRRNDAVRAFAALKATMIDTLGTRPGPELVAFNAELLADDERALHAGTRIRLGLRSAPNALLGREYDVDALEDLVATSRLTTILGAGGLGKTRLAQEIGTRAIHTPAVVFVELASVRSGDDIELALASTLGIREARSLRASDPGAQLDLRSRILGILAERETLLIVDNCEHIVDAAAAWVADILESTTTVRVLATSRAPLAIAAERVYPLEPLASAGGPAAGGPAACGAVAGGAAADGAVAGGPAVALFVERARAARPNVVLPPDVIARLCDRLDGLPLAIELAAARTRAMSVEEIERRLGNRFALLTGGERNAPERHRTLLAVIDWSWNLLTSSERVLLRRLALFPDGFSAEAAEAVAGDRSGTVLDDLEALVNQSLVSVTEDRSTGILRYRMLETVREFGELALVEADELVLVREAMFAWATAFSRRTLSTMHGTTQIASFNNIQAEQDNLVAILRLAVDERRGADIAAVFAALAYYWSLRSAHTEVLSFGTVVVGALAGWTPAGPEREDAAAAYTMIGATFLYLDVRTAARAISRLRHITREAPLTDARLDALSQLVQLAGRFEQAMELLGEFRRSPDAALAAMGGLVLAQFGENSGDLDEALAMATEAGEKAAVAGDTWAIASAAQAIAQLHSQLAHPAQALAWAERSRAGLSLLQAEGDLRQLDWIIAINAIAAGELDRGRLLLETYLGQEQDPAGFDYVDFYGIGYSGLAEAALAEGDLEEGLRLYEQAVGVFGRGDVITNPWMTILGAANLSARLRAQAAGHDLDRERTDTLARELRIRLLVSHRLRPVYVDKPVMGAGLLGAAAWMLDAQTRTGRDTGWIARGVELFALADRSNSRQDMPSLHRAAIGAVIRAAVGDRMVDDAIADAQSLDRSAAVLRGLAVLREVRF